MTEAETIAAVEAVFIEAGWKPLPDGSSIAGRFCAVSGPGWIVGGQFGGASHVKVTWAAADGVDTPNDPVEAARWLVARASAPMGVSAGPMTPETGESNVRKLAFEDSGDDTDLGQEIADWQDETGQDAGDEVHLDGQQRSDGVDAEAGGDVPLRLSAELAGDDTSRTEGVADLGGRNDGDERAEASLAYPGLILERLSDELSIRRAQVIDRIFAYRDIRLDALMDPSRREDLAHAFATYQNKGALGLPVTAQEEQDYHAYQAWAARETRLRQHADALCRSARDADLTMLKAMAEGIHEGWPSDG